MANATPSRRMAHHDWHSKTYVAEWIAKDVTRDDERRPVLRRMIAMAPYPKDRPIDVLDVGGGYGIVTDELFRLYPAARAVLQDYSAPMLEKARENLAAHAAQVRYVECDLLEPSWTKAVGGPFDLVVSAIAIHNLGDRESVFACYRAVRSVVKPGGLFLNYDRYPGGLEPYLAALKEAGFGRVDAEPLTPPVAILAAHAA